MHEVMLATDAITTKQSRVACRAIDRFAFCRVPNPRTSDLRAFQIRAVKCVCSLVGATIHATQNMWYRDRSSSPGPLSSSASSPSRSADSITWLSDNDDHDDITNTTPQRQPLTRNHSIHSIHSIHSKRQRHKIPGVNSHMPAA